MSLVDTALPKGSQALYVSLRDAGMSSAKKLRNVPWVNVAKDKTGILNAWRREIYEREDCIVAVVDARSWKRCSTGARRSKRDAVIRELTARHGLQMRVVVLESRSKAPRAHSGTRFDDGATWLVEDTGKDFLLWRGRVSLEANWLVPENPEGFGQLKPGRKQATSDAIERSSAVKAFTLKRAGNRCEIQGCHDGQDFKSPDVHHITRLGDNGSDHTDNTVALCPACHCRVHRGTNNIKKNLEATIEAIRGRRNSSTVGPKLT